MDTETLTNPAEPVVDDGSYGGYAKIARTLSAMHPERPRDFSRQLVERWYKNRGHNHFPESHPVLAKTGKVKNWFNLDEVVKWHVSYRRGRGKAKQMTIYEVTAEGRPSLN